MKANVDETLPVGNQRTNSSENPIQAIRCI